MSIGSIKPNYILDSNAIYTEMASHDLPGHFPHHFRDDGPPGILWKILAG
jgi:hypothetical protein